VVSASDDRTLKVWELASERAVATLQGRTHKVNACAVTPDGRHVVSASDDQTLKVWELASGRAVATLQGHTDTVNACAVTPDGRHVVSASEDKTLKVWNLATHACRFTHRGDSAYRAVAVTTTALLAGDLGGTVWFLDVPPSMVSPMPQTRQPSAQPCWLPISSGGSSRVTLPCGSRREARRARS
jgi:WD40 repeat protein